MCDLNAILSEMPIEADVKYPLSDDTAAIIVPWLERAVQRYRFNDPGCSVQLAKVVILIGELRGNLRERALGAMLYADSLWQKEQGSIQTAWDKLEEAASLFRAAGDNFGWARTRIGRMAMCYDMQRTDEALADADRAEQIFIAAARPDRLLALRANKATVYNTLGKYEAALDLLIAALKEAIGMGRAGRGYLAALCRSIGYSYSYLGDLDMAQAYYEKSYRLDRIMGWHSAMSAAQLSLAYIARARGDYHTALRILLESHDRLGLSGAGSAEGATRTLLYMADIYLELNRYREAAEFATDAVTRFETMGRRFDQAFALVLQGRTQVGLRQLEPAMQSFNRAYTIFADLELDVWCATSQLHMGLVALKQNQLDVAHSASSVTADLFAESSSVEKLAQAKLLHARVQLQLGEPEIARNLAQQVMDVAFDRDLPTLKYDVQVVMGQIAEADGDTDAAIAAYRMACETLWGWQQNLTITLRPDFLADKHAAAHALIRLYLQHGGAERAYETIERIKAQIVLGEVHNIDRMRWQAGGERMAQLVNRVTQLRAEHQYVYRLLNPPPTRSDSGDDLTREQYARLRQENAEREQHIARLTEQLYLEAATAQHRRLIDLPDLRAIQSHIPDDAVLLAFYDDGATLWAFRLRRDTPLDDLHPSPLPLRSDQFARLLRNLQQKFDFALDVRDHPDVLDGLLNVTQDLLAELYNGLFAPLVDDLDESVTRLIIVPYGALHYLPFAALYDGASYLCQRFEIVTLPAASLLTEPPPKQEDGTALVIGHSWDGYLQSTIKEAGMIRDLCGGDLYVEDAARLDVLSASPRKILHFSTHGEYRLDYPNLSYLLLDDGQVNTDDLLQRDMRYELVVLSACETWKADVAPGDELIGLGRGFLYAGAGAVIASLWQIDSDVTLNFMCALYGSLLSGESKAAALRRAQTALLTEPESRHPVFWAAFQLVGNPDPIYQRR